MEKILGKIEKVRYGFGGYDDAMFGLSLTFSMDGGKRGVSDFRGTWITRSSNAQFSESEWLNSYTNTAVFIRDLLLQAKVKEISQLAGTPVEVEVDQNTLKSWRVLTEVL